ncbi:hypothetical protein MHC_03730 [Mycoplasma haemocanis str. Illinois]|uniref:Uncharacterized protein n=1 Tax=Mycoplasma haemocanis (strain Illinois) TaxID=1111676 RepID=H6N7I4_MYCHN|nr:hypothetical protein [Mycoplasma haemocanis]AEW45606.1 hypothetical protein MHC_03730 [Mycoplasma haemocanis str. Illinois]
MVPVYKWLVGVGVLGGTSVGFGIENLTSSEFRDSKLSTKSLFKKKHITINKECRLHELIAISNGNFKPVAKEEIKRRIVEDKKGDFSPVEKACLKNAGKDVFVSRWHNRWGYHDEHQNSKEHKDKFQAYLKKSDSKQ